MESVLANEQNWNKLCRYKPFFSLHIICAASVERLISSSFRLCLLTTFSLFPFALLQLLIRTHKRFKKIFSNDNGFEREKKLLRKMWKKSGVSVWTSDMMKDFGVHNKYKFGLSLGCLCFDIFSIAFILILMVPPRGEGKRSQATTPTETQRTNQTSNNIKIITNCNSMWLFSFFVNFNHDPSEKKRSKKKNMSVWL